MLHSFKIRFFVTLVVSFSFLTADTIGIVDAINQPTIEPAKAQKPVESKGKYYCRADKQYQGYLSGFAKNLNSVTGYDTKETCEKSCFVKKTCQALAKDVKSVKIADSKNINVDSINKFLVDNASKIVGLELILDGEVYDFRTEGPLGIFELFLEPVYYKLKTQSIKISASPNSFTLTMFDGKTEVGSIQIDRNTLKVVSGKDVVKTASYQNVNGKDQTLIQTLSYDKNGKRVYTPEVKDGKVDFYKLVGITKTNSNVVFNGASIPLRGSIDKQTGEKNIHYEGSEQNKIAIGAKDIIFIAKTDGSDLVKDTHYNILYNAKDYKEYQINALIENKKDLYTCPYNINTKGDVGDNVFSSQKTCDNACSIAATCQFEEPKEPTEADCTIEEQLLDGVGDSDGKFIYETKKIIKTCKRTRKKQTGCELYDTKTVFSSDAPDYLKKMPNVETNLQEGDFSKGVAVFTKASAAEQVAHIFSGEEDYCDSGTFLDRPNWTEMGIKYGMMILGPLFTQGGFGEAYDKGFAAGEKATAEAGGNAVDQAVGGFFHGVGSGIWNNLKGYGAEIMKNFTAKGWETIGDQIAKNAALVIVSKDLQLITQAIQDSKKEKERQGSKNDIAFMSNGASVGADKKNVKTYEELGGALDEEDKKAADYAKCMTTQFGLYPSDIMNYHMGLKPKDLDDEEEQKRLENLYFPSKNFARLSSRDLAVLMIAMQEKDPNSEKEKNAYFDAHYRVKIDSIKGDDGKDLSKYYLKSLNGTDYMIAAETVCGGADMIAYIRKKYGARFMNPDLKIKPTAESLQAEADKTAQALASPPPKEKDDDYEKTPEEEMADLTNQMLDMMIGTIPFPYNVLASILKDYAELFSQGNTCIDEEFAKKRKQKDSKNGDMYVKTNKRIAGDLCYSVGEDSKFEQVFPFTYRARKYYCCYDQKLTKIFAQGIMDELGRKLDKDSCSNISPDDLDKISFNECEKGQDPQKDKCFPKERFDELSQTILEGGSIGSDDLLKNIIKSTLQLKQKLEDPDPINPKDIVDTGNQSKGGE